MEGEVFIPHKVLMDLVLTRHAFKELVEEYIEMVEYVIKAGDWKVDGACDPDSLLERSKKLLKGVDEKQQR